MQNLKTLEDVLVIWIGEVNVKNGAATDKIINEKADVIAQMNFTNFCNKI